MKSEVRAQVAELSAFGLPASTISGMVGRSLSGVYLLQSRVKTGAKASQTTNALIAARAEIGALRRQIAELENALWKPADGQPVATQGGYTPARGVLLASHGELGWVMFEGADQPRTMPLKYLAFGKAE